MNELAAAATDAAAMEEAAAAVEQEVRLLDEIEVEWKRRALDGSPEAVDRVRKLCGRPKGMVHLAGGPVLALLRLVEETPHPMTTPTKHILVVDDDPGIRELLSALLEDEGYTVETAAEGFQGLDQAAASHPDVVILDFNMPHCDGPGFAARYRRERDHAPIILLTASLHLRERCKQVHADGCIGKPFDIDNFLNVVESHSHSHALSAAA